LTLLKRALKDKARGLGAFPVRADKKALEFLAAADPDVGPLPVLWDDAAVTWLDSLWTWGGGTDPDVAKTSWPVDPAYCPEAWLPWLARLLGADITGLNTEQARWYLARRGRSAVGSDQGIKDAVGATLSGSRLVVISKPSTWEMTLTLISTEVTDAALTLAVALRAKPTGVELTVTTDDPATYADLAADYTDYAEITATGKTYDQLRFG
jgi:hypothetical protein